MATTRLTPGSVAALATDRPQLEVWDDVVPGLALRLGRGGSKTYVVRYGANGKHRQLTIGRHPHLSLADARPEGSRRDCEGPGRCRPGPGALDAPWGP